MYSKSAIALVAVLDAFAFAVPTVSHAADQSEWLQRQLQNDRWVCPAGATGAGW